MLADLRPGRSTLPTVRGGAHTEAMSEGVLVVFTTADGSTAEVAERLGEHIRAQGVSAQVTPVSKAPDLAGFDTIVLGSPIHDGALLPDLVDYVDSNVTALRARPVWLFSLGMGPTLRGPVGALMRTKVPPQVAAVRDQVGAVAYHNFAGKFGRPPDIKIRIVMGLIGARPGDHRDWDDVEQWADRISRSLDR